MQRCGSSPERPVRNELSEEITDLSISYQAKSRSTIRRCIPNIDASGAINQVLLINLAKMSKGIKKSNFDCQEIEYSKLRCSRGPRNQ